jgi:DNA (cytosine-5)-methyltransferase 1
MVWRGECLTANISESPSRASESMLLPCIETQPVPDKYFLSRNAAVGILRRVDQMGRNLPASFRRSLEILARGRSYAQLPAVDKPN